MAGVPEERDAYGNFDDKQQLNFSSLKGSRRVAIDICSYIYVHVRLLLVELDVLFQFSKRRETS